MTQEKAELWRTGEMEEGQQPWNWMKWHFKIILIAVYQMNWRMEKKWKQEV